MAELALPSTTALGEDRDVSPSLALLTPALPGDVARAEPGHHRRAGDKEQSPRGTAGHGEGSPGWQRGSGSCPHRSLSPGDVALSLQGHSVPAVTQPPPPTALGLHMPLGFGLGLAFLGFFDCFFVFGGFFLRGTIPHTASLFLFFCAAARRAPVQS